MFRKPTMPALFVGILLVCSVHGFAQSGRSRVVTSPPKYTRSQMLKVTAELSRQQKFLRDVASRYEAVANYDFAPLLKYSYVWIALRENREKLNSASLTMTPDQGKLFRSTYEQLETDVVMSFLDHQLSILNEALELDEAQSNALQQVLTFDLGRKRLLLSDHALTSAQFMHKIAEVSESTEKRLVELLSPEQRAHFNQQMMATHDRLVA